MFQHTGRLKATLGLLGLALAGCTTNPEIQDQETGLTLRSAIGNTCVNEGDVGITFNIEIWADNTGPEGVPDNQPDTELPLEVRNGVGLTDVFNITELDAGEGADEDLTGIWVGGDEFILLAPGHYVVRSTAVGTSVDLMPSDVQTDYVTIIEGETTEVVFAYQCEGQTISALDVVVLVSQGPSIVGWSYSPNKFAMLCETTQMTATFENDNNLSSSVNVTFQMFSSAQADYTGPLPSATPDHIATYTTPATAPANGAPFDVSWNYPHPGPAGTFYVYVTITDSAGVGYTTFQALFHAYTPLAGFAFDDSLFTNQDDYWGLNSCEQGDQVLLDFSCAKNQLVAPKPDRTTVCALEPAPQAVTDWYSAHPECAPATTTWEYPGDYMPLGLGNLSGQWGAYDGTCESAGGGCPYSMVPVWSLDGTEYPGACEAQRDCATYTTSNCADPTP